MNQSPSCIVFVLMLVVQNIVKLSVPMCWILLSTNVELPSYRVMTVSKNASFLLCSRSQVNCMVGSNE